MVFRILFRYLANNEHLVQKLSESYPVRRAAQLAISIFYKSKNLTEDYKLKGMTPEKFRSFFKNFQNNIKQELKEAKDEIKKRKF